jgi:uncharacterized protein (DUF1697 family)
MRYAAFMRGLNLGKRTVKMEELKKLFVKIGFAEVESFIASGNIVFETASKDRTAMERKIEAAIEKKYGWVSETFVRDFGELARVGKAMPFQGVVDAPTYLVGFLKGPIDADAKKKFLTLASPQDKFAVTGAEIWWYSDISQAESKFNANMFDKALGVRSTWRNLRTIRRMVERWSAAN